MTDLEQMNVNIQRQIDAQNARIDSVLAKVDMLVAESQQQREDIRRAQEKHDADMRELRERQDAAQAKHDAEMHEMNQRFYEKVDSINKEFVKELHSNFVQTMIGVGAMIATLGGILIAALK